MDWDAEKVLANLRQASTEDLVDRVTAYRQGMEPEAVALIERELHARGVSAAQLSQQREIYERECVFHADGTAAMCSFCRKPAVKAGWGWHKLWRLVPVFPRWFYYCRDHASSNFLV